MQQRLGKCKTRSKRQRITNKRRQAWKVEAEEKQSQAILIFLPPVLAEIVNQYRKSLRVAFSGLSRADQGPCIFAYDPPRGTWTEKRHTSNSEFPVNLFSDQTDLFVYSNSKTRETNWNCHEYFGSRVQMCASSGRLFFLPVSLSPSSRLFEFDLATQACRTFSLWPEGEQSEEERRDPKDESQEGDKKKEGSGETSGESSTSVLSMAASRTRLFVLTEKLHSQPELHVFNWTEKQWDDTQFPLSISCWRQVILCGSLLVVWGLLEYKTLRLDCECWSQSHWTQHQLPFAKSAKSAKTIEVPVIATMEDYLLVYYSGSSLTGVPSFWKVCPSDNQWRQLSSVPGFQPVSGASFENSPF